MSGISDKLEKINLLQENIQKLNPSKSWSEKFIEKVKLDFTFYSNKLENNVLAYGQTIRFLKEAVTPKGAPLKDCLDMENHFKVLDTIFTIHNTQQLNAEHVLNLHKELMKDNRQWDTDSFYSPGKYKIRENYVQNSEGKIKAFVAPELVKESVENMFNEIDMMNDNKDHPLKTATYFHNRFILEIHPFEDGNGRTGRIVMNEMLLKADLPPIFVNPDFKKEDRIQYLSLCEKSDSKNSVSMMNYFADLLIHSLETKKELMLQFEKET